MWNVGGSRCLGGSGGVRVRGGRGRPERVRARGEACAGRRGALACAPAVTVAHDIPEPAATTMIADRWPVLAGCVEAGEWLRMLADLGRSPRTIDAYARALTDYFGFCERACVNALTASRGDVARYVRDLRERPARGGVGLANATVQLRLTALRLFCDHLVWEGVRERNPVGRGRYTPGRWAAAGERGLVARSSRLPWIPTDEQWRALLEVARGEPLRNRLMLALAYDAALRREELCLLQTDDIDPAHRTLRIRAETTKTRRGRVVPYSAVAGELLQSYLRHRATVTRARGALLVSESRRNRGEPITPWTWSKIVRSLALRAELPGFSTHTLRHLCLTDLARSRWELHAIATFAGHQSTQTTLQYIHLSGRDLAAKLERGMAEIHAQRVAQIGAVLA
jgi:integrase/recombinase XerD